MHDFRELGDVLHGLPLLDRVVVSSICGSAVGPNARQQEQVPDLHVRLRTRATRNPQRKGLPALHNERADFRSPRLAELGWCGFCWRRRSRNLDDIKDLDDYLPGLQLWDFNHLLLYQCWSHVLDHKGGWAHSTAFGWVVRAGAAPWVVWDLPKEADPFLPPSLEKHIHELQPLLAHADHDAWHRQQHWLAED